MLIVSIPLLFFYGQPILCEENHEESMYVQYMYIYVHMIPAGLITTDRSAERLPSSIHHQRGRETHQTRRQLTGGQI